MCTGIVSVALKKAFDTVDHDILLEKLSHYGIKNTEHKWFSFYVGNRRQCCRVNGITSNFENITCGVPQGSCLGPLLFLLYINDMPCVLKCSKVTMYTDDSSLAHSAKDVKDITSTINAELENLKVWLHGNKLSLNVAKTTSMLIGFTTHTINYELTAEPLRANFMISGEQIEQKPSIKYLGVHIDNKLLKAVASKVTRAIAMIRHTKKFLPKHTLKVLYQGLVEPHFRLCCSVWGTCGVTTRCNLEKLQNRAIRIITDSPFDAPAKPLLRHLRLPSIAELIRQKSVGMVYKAINGQAPVYLFSLFNRTSAVTNRMLRNSNLHLRPPRMKTTFGQDSFAYREATIWNSLPIDCKTAHTSRTFEMKLKAMLA